MKNINNLTLSLIGVLVIFLCLYLVAAFASWEINPGRWVNGTRTTVAIFTVVFWVIWSGIVISVKEEK